MSKLLLTIDQNDDLGRGEAQKFFASNADHSLLTGHIGKPILLANTSLRRAFGIIAQGYLRDFKAQEDGTYLTIERISEFPTVRTFDGQPNQSAILTEMSDMDYDIAVIKAGTGGYMNDVSQQATFAVKEASFTARLATLYNNRCNFSDVPTSEGAAYIIRPLDQGGRWHLSNFLFLDPEPGELFLNFAWTVGPKLQIIMDAYAVGSDVSDTVNRTAMLHLPAKTADWPDRDALAWHFEQFNKRLAAERN